ncbi:MAG: DUF3667 domain-containing protein [Spirosoma sp.]|nr:DUF3667 domain-containing protein [Spirosoma sp.]
MLAKTSTTPSHGHSADGLITCQNCDHEYVGRYCGQCGQRSDTHRINWHYIWHEIPHSVWHYDSGILFSIRELITRPGYTIRDFLNGKRVKHYRPLALLLILGAILVFASHSLNVSFIARGQEAIGTPANASDRVKTFQQDVNQFVEKNQTIINIALIPLYAFWFWLLFRRRGYNYPEILVAQTFITNFNFMSSLIIVLMVWALGGSVSAYRLALGLSVIVTIAYNAWVYMKLFKGKLRPLTIIIRSITAFMAAYVSFMVIVGVIGLVYGISVGMADANVAKSKQPYPTTVQKPH